MIARIACVIAALMLTAAASAQQFGPAQYPIKADDGDLLTNHALSPAQIAQLGRLPGAISVGGKLGDVTVYQFYDLNCPFCREAAADVDALVTGDPALRLVFVPYPVLSAQSIEGARVELALRQIAPQSFLAFHRRIYAGRGVIDGARALAVTQELGLDQSKIVAAANTQAVTDAMVTHAKLGDELGLKATPAYIVQGVAILGHPGLEPLRKLVASVRACKKVVC